MVVQAIMAPLALNRVNQPLTEATNQSVDDLDDDAMQVSQLCTLAQLAGNFNISLKYDGLSSILSLQACML